MTARTAIPPAVADELVAAELKALDRNLHRYVRAVAIRRHAGLGAPLTVDPGSVLERAAARITEIQEETDDRP